MIRRALLSHLARHRAVATRLRSRHRLLAGGQPSVRPRFIPGHLPSEPGAGTPDAPVVPIRVLGGAPPAPEDLERNALSAEDALQPAPAQAAGEFLAPEPYRPRAAAAAAPPPSRSESAPASSAPPPAGRRPTPDEMRDTLLQLRAIKAQPLAPAQRPRPPLGRRVEHVADSVMASEAPSMRGQTKSEPAEATTEAAVRPAQSEGPPPEPVSDTPVHPSEPPTRPPVSESASLAADAVAVQEPDTAKAESEPAPDFPPPDFPPPDLPATAPTPDVHIQHAQARRVREPGDDAGARQPSHGPAVPAGDGSSRAHSEARREGRYDSHATNVVPSSTPVPGPAGGDSQGLPDEEPSPNPQRPKGAEPTSISLAPGEPAKPPTPEEPTGARPLPDVEARSAARHHMPEPVESETEHAEQEQQHRAHEPPAYAAPGDDRLKTQGRGAARSGDELSEETIAAPGGAEPPRPATVPPTPLLRAAVAARQSPEPAAAAAFVPPSLTEPDQTVESAHEQLGAPSPLRPTTRRFLRPLLGFDPADARVYRGPAAAQVAAAHQAAAVMSGDEIALAEEHVGDSPRMLGVLAHELTHVARRHRPRFVPPIARSGVPAPAMVDEERLARAVEARVSAAARSGTGAAPAPEWSPAGATLIAGDQPPFIAMPGRTSAARPGPTAAPPEVQGAGEPDRSGLAAGWSGLPAPWESLPAWLSSATPAQPAAAAGQQPTRPDRAAQQPADVTPGAPPRLPPGAPEGSSAPMPVQRAALDRGLPERLTAAQLPPPGAPQQPAGGVDPDLDALARQIYAILRQRLAAERRRMG